MGNQNLVGLRHDVDHDLDMALELAHFEHQRDIKSSYYLLDTESYWRDPLFDEKIRQLDDYGHEVGVHVNAISKWFRNEITDIEADLKVTLERLRGLGIKVDTISAHGDKLCYMHQFINYWCFSELRAADPATVEDGLSAEGISTEDDRFQIRYPESSVLTREDGDTLPLWDVSMARLCLKADAMHIPIDHYFTDSGGDWKRSPDPLDCNLGKGRHQVVMHPEYWRGPQKLYFFLSAPRSGSTWLANFIDKSTPARCQHEFLLNHEYTGSTLIENKRTTHGITSLLTNRGKVEKLLGQGGIWIDALGQDYAEANVYLHHFLPEIKKLYPDAIYIHLYRNPKDVIRSLYNRGWYMTPDNPRHPRLDMSNWAEFSRIRKLCWFVRTVNENLMKFCSYNLCFERMVSDREYLARHLSELGIAVHPRIAKKIHGMKLNENRNSDFPDFEFWNDSDKSDFVDTMGSILQKLGYTSNGGGYRTNKWRTFGRRIYKHLYSYRSRLLNKFNRPLFMLSNNSKIEVNRVFWTSGCDISSLHKSIEVSTSVERHALIVLGNGKWNSISSPQWINHIDSYYKGSCSMDSTEEFLLTVFCLMYDYDGLLVHKEVIALIDFEKDIVTFEFKCRADAAYFTLAVYHGREDVSRTFLIKELKLERVIEAI